LETFRGFWLGAAKAMTVIQVENIGKRYRVGESDSTGLLSERLGSVLRDPASLFRRSSRDAFWALKDVSFEVRQGEVLGLIGRNGAGKSTLLKILSRITKPTVGRAQIHGRVGSLLEVGTGFHPELTGRENVFLNGAILGMGRREITRKFDEIVAFAEVERFIDTPVKRYSSGMYVRLAFAVAAHLETEILFVDEVLSVGDLAFQRKCLSKMQDISREGRTLIFISHHMNQIRRLCNRVIWVHRGAVHQSGGTADVVSAYEAAMASAVDRQTSFGTVRSSVARFVGWEITGPQGPDPHKLSHLGPTKVRFLLEVNRTIQHAVHGITLYSPERQIIWGWAAYDLALAPGATEFVYDFPMLPLKPGIYSWMVSLWDDDGLIDAQDLAPEMLVSTPWHQHPRDEWSGMLNIPSQFAIRCRHRPETESAQASASGVLGQ
jgi:ABC-type polysaccharide/polyol phosphate transport system ATPase subunit